MDRIGIGGGSQSKQWKQAVATVAALPTTDVDLAMRVVDDDGDGKSAIYQFDEGTATWTKIADVDAAFDVTGLEADIAAAQASADAAQADIDAHEVAVDPHPTYTTAAEAAAAAPVQSVNGFTGAVALGFADVNALADLAIKNVTGFRMNGASGVGIGVVTPSLSGVGTNLADADGDFTGFNSANGATAGLDTANFTVVQGQHSPDFIVVGKLGSDITSTRLYLLLTANVAINDDNGPLNCVGLFYSTVLTHTGFRPFSRGAAGAGTVGAQVGSNLANNDEFKVRIRSTDGGVTWKVSVNLNGAGYSAESTISLTLPATGQSLGWTLRIFSQVVGTRTLKLSRARCFAK
jgi:hypothetical protein